MRTLGRAWAALLRDGALNASVVEMTGDDARPAIAGFGASVFVTDAWAADARSSREPYLTARTIARELDGRSPILRPRSIARSNAGGLNVLILHYGESATVPPLSRPALRYRMFESLVDTHRGYRLKDVLQEFWDEIDTEFVIHGWGRVITDYATFFDGHRRQWPPPGRRPHLIGITREECLANPGTLAAPLFVHVPPRLSLTRAEQRMMGLALRGNTDIELARTLRLALPTIKSRWRGIYDRVGRVAPELLTSTHPSSSRGQEKRRHLLEYVRRHPEELRAAFVAGR
jgi:DNA-binding CsgD family transcriptional regulator